MTGIGSRRLGVACNDAEPRPVLFRLQDRSLGIAQTNVQLIGFQGSGPERGLLPTSGQRVSVLGTRSRRTNT